MFNIAYQAATKDDAKTELQTRNAELETPMGDDMRLAVEATIDALGGTGVIGVGLYGTDDQLNLSLQRLPA